LFQDTEEKSAGIKCLRHASVDFKGLGQVDIQIDGFDVIRICRVLEQQPRIPLVRNHHLSAHRPDVFLPGAELETGQFQDSPFDWIHWGTALNRKFRPRLHSGSSPPYEASR
jgi:hypothetical protein